MPSTKWHDFGNGAYALTSGSNIGVIIDGQIGLMVDAGLDYDSARKALRELDARDVIPIAILITHGHADHFGGAGPVAQRTEAQVYAPPFESAFVQFPILEPYFLHGGADPIEELRSKFTLAEQGAGLPLHLAPGPLDAEGINVDVVSLPGHAPNQMGIAYNGTFYCGDAVFPESTLERHPILFCADMDSWLTTLARLPEMSYDHYVAGHGSPVEDIGPLAEATEARLREIRDVTLEAIREPAEPYGVLRTVAAHFDVTFDAPQFFLLSLTTVQAALASLQRAGEAEIVMEDNQVLWRAV
jgi:glyoxylase-like metal-dependent hydrolase (beta-lactamase superfamily II)